VADAADCAILVVEARLTPADHQTHRRYAFVVPERCRELRIRARYTPKFVSRAESEQLVEQAVASQTAALAQRVGQARAERWAAELHGADLIVPNLLTISVDDAHGVYRGAGHRHTPDQQLTIGLEAASPGLVPGPLDAGEWTLTLSAHTLVSAQCEVRIQIGAVTA
jgi:hypothetical protein